MKYFLLLVLAGAACCRLPAQAFRATAVSARLVQQARSGTLVQADADSLAQVSLAELIKALPNDRHKKAFWLNLYNAYAQRNLVAADLATDEARLKAFNEKNILVANEKLSLNEIEHSLLRKGSSVLGGLLFGGGTLGKGKPARSKPSEIEKVLAVDTLDARIHFALNFCAVSCPPVRVYTPDNLEATLALAASVYIKQECRYYPQTVEALVPKLFDWYAADFGGEHVIAQMLKSASIVPARHNPRLRYKDWIWRYQKGKYAE